MSSYDNGVKQPVFSIIAKEANEEQKEEKRLPLSGQSLPGPDDYQRRMGILQEILPNQSLKISLVHLLLRISAGRYISGTP